MEVKEFQKAKEVEEAREVNEETHGNLAARGRAEKVCYDANHRVSIDLY
jgi:hypothetical protein